MPAREQPSIDEDLGFLERLETRESLEGEPPFVGGWLGFLTYDLGLEWMGLQSQHRSNLPKMWWRFCDEVYAFQVTNEAAIEFPSFSVKDFQSTLSREVYENAIVEIHRLERDGDTYQVNFAQEFLGEFSGDPFGLYTRLFAANPSAMCFYAEDEDWAICSNSPERLVSLRGRTLRAEPIKGTVGRGEDPSFLLRDEKSQAELTMIVDLLRNDLGKVARLGTVKVPEHQSIMELANVYHTYSVVEAELAEGKTIANILRALFPGGSITGCPKKRTMEIIDRLENFSRGAYCGSAGYVSVNGHADFNIMIRTATVQNGRVSFPSGGGIVMDSKAEAELQESVQKADVISQLILT